MSTTPLPEFKGAVDSEEGIYETRMFVNGFEAASTGYRLAHREAIIADADNIALGELAFLQSRSRHLLRNNPIAESARKKYVAAMGSVNVRWVKPDGSTHSVAQKLWDDFAENPSLDEKGDFNTFQNVLNNDRFASGEGIARMLTSSSDRILPFKLQGIESEYLDISYMGQDEADLYPLGLTRYGITFDRNTKSIPEFYNFFQDRHFGLHPELNFKHVKVPAKQILHSFERIRSNQWRGIPLLASSLVTLYEFEDLCTATVRAQTSASAITWVVSEFNSAIRDPAGVVKLLGKNATNDSEKKLVFDTSGGTAQYTSGKFNLVQSRDIGSNLLALLRDGYQKVSSALDIPYYLLSGDTSGLDFSSLRGVLTSFRQSITNFYTVQLIPDFLRPTCYRFKDVALAMGYSVADASPTYQFPRWFGVDDLKDAQADFLEITSGLEPIQKKWLERGHTQEEIEHGIQIIKDLGLEGIMSQTPNPTQNNSAPTNNTTGS